jgi:hypothetical protein
MGMLSRKEGAAFTGPVRAAQSGQRAVFVSGGATLFWGAVRTGVSTRRPEGVSSILEIDCSQPARKRVANARAQTNAESLITMIDP